MRYMNEVSSYTVVLRFWKDRCLASTLRNEVAAVNSLLQAIYELREKGRALQRHCVVAEVPLASPRRKKT